MRRCSSLSRMPKPGARKLESLFSATTARTTGTLACSVHPRVPIARRAHRAYKVLRRDEVVTLADIGALNSFGYDRRSALWQAERAVRPAGELFNEAGEAGWAREGRRTPASNPLTSQPPADCPLRPMTESERLVADYAGNRSHRGTPSHGASPRRARDARRFCARSICGPSATAAACASPAW